LKLKAKKDELQETVDLRAAGLQSEAIAIVLSDKGKDIMDSIRVVIDTMQNEELSLLENRKEKTLGAEQNTRTIIIFGSIAGILAAIYIALVISRYIGFSIGKLRSVAFQIAKGNMNVFVNTNGRNELAQLSQSIETMRQNLKKSIEEIKARSEDLSLQLTETEKAKKSTQNALIDVQKEKNIVTLEKDKIDTILHSIGDGVFVIDKEFKIIMFNQVASDISGFSAQEAIGKKYNEILKFNLESTEKENDRFIKDAMATGNIQEMSNHTVLIKKDGSKIAVADSAAPLKNEDSKVTGCVIVFRDVTKEREIDKAKTEFVSFASHQLRTPLTVVKWYSDALLAGGAGKLNKKQKELAEQIFTSNTHMIALVNALLNVSRLDLGTFAIEPEPTDFIEIADSVLAELLPQIEEKKMHIEKRYGADVPHIDADPKLMRIVFQNLLSNAVKYTPAEGTVTITIEKKASNLFFSVTDTGFGIPKHQQDKVFNKLFRADNIQIQNVSGTGLGLYIVKAIIDAGGGAIWFESEENKGTAFSVTIPLSGMKKKSGVKGLS